MEFTPAFCLVVTGIQFVCFFIKGLAGFGDPLISNPALSLMMDNKFISPTNLMLGTPINAYISYKNRKSFSMKQALPTAACIMLGVIPGTLLLKYATSWVLKACLGVLILGIGVEMITRNRAKPIKPNALVRSIVSFFSGVTAGLYGINLFFVAYTERTTTNRESFRGNICFIFLVENVFRILVYWVSGVFNQNILLLFLSSLPGMLLGFALGSRVDKKISETTVRKIIITMFMLGGFSVLIKALIWRV